MRYWLHVHGSAGEPTGQPLRRDDLGETDEVLCGACNALLTVDHHVWVNAGGPNLPGQSDGLVSCQLCGSLNDTAWATTVRP